jgi:uncharacterized protein
MLKHYPAIKNAIYLLLLFIAAESLLTIAAFVCIHIQGGNPFGQIQMGSRDPFLFGGIELVSAVLVLAIGFKKSKTPFRQVFPLGSAPAVVFAASGLGIIGLSIVLSDLNNLLHALLNSPPDPQDFFVQLFRNKNIFATLFMLSVIAPFTEEFLFRGLIFTGFLNNYSLRKAILGSATLFALIHLYIYQIPGAFVYGIAFAWLTVKTNSLWPAIVSHALANCLPVISERVLHLSIPGFTCPLNGKIQFQPLWFDAMGLVLVGLSAWLLLCKWRDKQDPDSRLMRTPIEIPLTAGTEVIPENIMETAPVKSPRLGWAALIFGVISILMLTAGISLILYHSIRNETLDLSNAAALAIGSIFLFGFVINWIGTAVSIAALIKKSKPAAAWAGIAMNGFCILFGIFLALMVLIEARQN